MSIDTLTALVHSLRYEAPGIISVELRPAAGQAPFPLFEAGSHIDLHLGNGLVRSYSLSHLPSDHHAYVVGVLNDRNSRGGSRYVHESLRVGTPLQISVPRNNFRLDESPGRSLLVAGGIGVTPLLCMLQRLVALGREVDFFYCARSRQEAAFLTNIEALANQNRKVRLHCYFDDERQGPPDLRALLSGFAPETRLYCCGPGPMLNAFEETCEALGYTHAYIERFSAKQTTEAASPEGYEVALRRSGKTLQVPAGKSLLDVLLDSGMTPDFSCKEGVCGACETKVLSGEVDHRDSVLTAQEQASHKSMMICVSRCRVGPLVLDL